MSEDDKAGSLAPGVGAGGIDREQARELLLPIVKAALRNAMEEKMRAAKDGEVPGPMEREPRMNATPEPVQRQVAAARPANNPASPGPMTFDVKRDGAGQIRQIVFSG